MQLRYPILILTLLFSFNVKAETYVCAYQALNVIRQDTFTRDGDVFRYDATEVGVGYTTKEYDVSENDYSQWIILNKVIFRTSDLFSVQISAINKETLEYITYSNLFATGSASDNSLDNPTYGGTCSYIP